MGSPSAPGGGPLPPDPLSFLQVPLGAIGIPSAPGGGPPELELDCVISQTSPEAQSDLLLHVAPSSPGSGFWQVVSGGGTGIPSAPGGALLVCTGIPSAPGGGAVLFGLQTRPALHDFSALQAAPSTP
jgi:hypothetical protein